MKRRADGRYLKVMRYKRADGTEYTKYFYDTTETGIFNQVAAYQEEVDQGRLFKLVAEDWKEEHYKRLVHNTQMGYNKSYNKAVAHFGATHIRKITPAMVRAYIAKFAQKGYASKTVTHHLSVLNLILTKAVIDGEILTNPAEHVRVPTGLKKTKRTPPTPEEVKAIKNGLDKPFGLFAYFILYTGLRKSEALALQWKDIDFERREITISKAWFAENNRPQIKPMPKTEAGKRVVPLLAPLERALTKGNPDYYVFGFLRGDEYRKLWEEYCSAASIHCTAHQIRHEFVTMLYDAGINEFDAMHIVGHADISTMRNIYTHIRESRIGSITDILNEKLTND